MSRVDDLIAALRLKPHPEGGWYGEIFRSAERVEPADGRTSRSALTTIYFLLASGQTSRLHRVASDEVWHFYEGGPLRLTTCNGRFENLQAITLGRLNEKSQPVHVVPAGWWQAAEPLEDYSLVGCTVGPGFDFADFALLGQDPRNAAAFLRMHPDLRRLV